MNETLYILCIVIATVITFVGAFVFHTNEAY
jgi:hypothetical protein